ncbi:MAG: hypothetical protein WCA76_21975 [Candidatus Sulfotelmatobacter sp.]|jgi:hypothetical protein
MAQPFDGSASDADQLSERVRELERRVSALEGRPAIAPPVSAAHESFALQKPRPPETWRGFPGPDVSAGVLPVFGKAVLGIAGAYLLRAVAESGIIPRLPLLMVAIVYAGMWLVWAVRTHAANHFASITYAITSAMILSPLLWESTVRFQILGMAYTAAVLVAFVVLALALAWRQNLPVIPLVAILAAVATALALIIATRELVPFTVGLLAVALAAEVVVCLGQRLSVRAVPAIAADFAVWLLVYVMTSPEGVPPEYRPIGATTITALSLALLAIYGGSAGMCSFGLRHRLTVFEIVQGVAVFALATFGTLRAIPGSAVALGVFFLLVAALCYWGALSRFTAQEQTRNRRVCATYAGALLLAGSFLLFSADFRSLFLCLAAVAAAFLYSRTGKLSLGMHASFYLAAAAAGSAFLNYAENALAGTVPAKPDWRVWMVAVSALLCYMIGSRVSEGVGRRRLLWVVPAVLFSFAAAALAIDVIVWLASSRRELSASHLAVIRTGVTCLLALALSFLGSRSKRVELGWVAYAAVAFGALKLLFEDLRFGNAGSLVLSLLFYGLILILIPRLTRLARAEP